MKLRFTHPTAVRKFDDGKTIRYNDVVYVNKELGAALLKEGSFEELEEDDPMTEEPATHVQAPDPEEISDRPAARRTERS